MPTTSARLKARIEGNGVKLIDPPPGFESNGFWFRNPEGVLIEVKVAPKVSPDQKSDSQWVTVGPGVAGATTRAKSPPVRPRRLSHVLIFTSDVARLDPVLRAHSRPAAVRQAPPTSSPSCTASTAAIIICWRW